jgi:uncharacterized protein YgiM (DUF1202 family)
MDWKRTCKLLIVAILLILPACNLPGLTGEGGADPAAATAAQETRVAEIVAQTVAAAVTDAPVFTLTPSQTPLPTLTFTPEGVTVSVSLQTNCRTGPGKAYPSVGVLNPGETTRVLGRDSTGSYWVVQNPDGYPNICWLWAYYATVSGNGQALPMATPPPTPTPVPDFTVSYLSVVACAGDYAFRFQIQNTGGLTWESIRIVASDNTAVSSTTHTRDSFKSFNGCAVDIEQNSLGPGVMGLVTSTSPGEIAYDPTGHSFTATVTLCSQDALAGTCVSRTLNFTP